MYKPKVNYKTNKASKVAQSIISKVDSSDSIVNADIYNAVANRYKIGIGPKNFYYKVEHDLSLHTKRYIKTNNIDFKLTVISIANKYK